MFISLLITLLFITSSVCAESIPAPEFIIHKVEILPTPVNKVKITANIRVLKLAKMHKKYAIFCDEEGNCMTLIINYKNDIKHTKILSTKENENKSKNIPEIKTINQRPYKVF